MAAGGCAGWRTRLERGWRRLATGLAFATFGTGTLLLTLFVAPVLFIGIRRRERRQACSQRLICGGFRLFMNFTRWLGLIEVNVHGRERLHEAAGVVIIANHPTLLDVVILLACLSRAQCVVKHQLWRNPLLTALVSAAGFIRNDQEPQALLDQCCDALRQNIPLILFPEGTRTPAGRTLGPLQRGVANIALATRADILPVCIRCNHATLKKGSRWYAVPETRIVYDLEVGQAFAPGGVAAPGRQRAKQARRLLRHIENHFNNRLTHANAGR